LAGRRAGFCAVGAFDASRARRVWRGAPCQRPAPAVSIGLGICQEPHVKSERNARLFRNGRNQAIRIPREFELPGTQARLRKEGEALIITPVKERSLLSTLRALRPIDEDFPRIEELSAERVDL
jgi:antitoxin VapB